MALHRCGLLTVEQFVGKVVNSCWQLNLWMNNIEDAPLMNFRFSIGRLATLACLREVAAAKPGNVHRGADFEDVTLEDFQSSAVILGQVIDEMAERGVGETILATIEATQAVTGTNTNLGLALLLVPLAKTAAIPNRQGEAADSSGTVDPTKNHSRIKSRYISQVLETLNANDSDQVFAAIRAAKPGGMGTVPEGDINNSAKSEIGLVPAMKLAADRDLIARQFTNGFEQVFQDALPLLVEGMQYFQRPSSAIVFAHVSLMARFPDSLIQRKCGTKVAEHSQMLAQRALDQFPESTDVSSRRPRLDSSESLELYWDAVGELDFWLRSDGHRRNPGTTADLIAAGLFVGMFNGEIEL